MYGCIVTQLAQALLELHSDSGEQIKVNNYSDGQA